MRVYVENDNAPESNSCCNVVVSVCMEKEPTWIQKVFKVEKLGHYCHITGYYDVDHELEDYPHSVEVHPGCNVIVRTGKGCCLKKHEYRIDSEGDIYSLYNDILFMLAMEKV